MFATKILVILIIAFECCGIFECARNEKSFLVKIRANYLTPKQMAEGNGVWQKKIVFGLLRDIFVNFIVSIF